MPAARYWRITAIDTYTGADLELSALHLYGAAGRIDGAATLTSTIAPTSGALPALQDDDLASTCRFAAAAVRSGGFAILWDFGAGNSADVTGLRLGSGASRGDFLAGCTLQYSQDGALWQWRGYFSRYDYPGAGTYSPVPVLGDEHFGKVTLLLHCDGADGSTVFTDSSATTKAVTAYGSAKISTAQGKFGGASLLLNGVEGYLTVPASADYVFGTGDFTVEGWIRTTTTSERALIDQYLTAAASWQLSVKNGVLTWYERDDALAGSYALTGTKPANDGQWHHVAATRASGVLRFFVDGVSDGSAAVVTNYTSSMVLGIGAQVAVRSAAYDFPGNIDEVRITKGVARYTANFMPPTETFAEGVDRAITFLPPLLRAPAPDHTRIAASSPVPPPSIQSAPRLQLARDTEFGGTGRIYGTTKIETSPTVRVPTKARVSILRARDKLVAREVWSDPVTGEWEVKGLDTRQDFVVLAQDAAGNYQPVAADKTMPEEMP